MVKQPNEGDIVYLNSGSPKLTVSAVDDKGVFVHWFDALGQAQSALFPAACLRATDPCVDPADQPAPKPSL